MSVPPKRFWQTFLAFSLGLALLALYQTQQQTQALLKMRTRYKWVVVMAVFALNVLLGIYGLWRKQGAGEWLEIRVPPALGRILGPLLLLLPFPTLWYVKYVFFGKALTAFFPLLWVWWWLMLLQAFGLRALFRGSWARAFSLALLLSGLVLQAYVIFQPVSDYPFSLGWSEASRYYYASLPFSRSIYGVELPLSVWHPTRYLLLSIPFVLKGLPLWAARLWQSLLWLGLSSLSAWALVRRLRPEGGFRKLLLGGWFFLYLFQGAVYYHLQVCVLIILLGVSSKHVWRSLLAVLLASFWAGMSRLNWYPLPAMLAIALYALEEPISRGGSLWRYAFPPVLWALAGLMTALAGQAFYIVISGNRDLSAFASSLHSPLLFYRWWPNATNPLGIVPGIVLVSLPLVVLLGWSLRQRLLDWHPLRSGLLLAMLLVLFAGGLIVSSKIGGGGDLHNMDAYMVMLALIGACSVTPRLAAESAPSSGSEAPPWPIVVGLLLVPLAFALARLAPPIQYDRAQAMHDLATLRAAVRSYSRSGEVLFIYERHLLTFGMIREVPLVPEYEVIYLMEMAISGNAAYLERFYRDLQNHRFAAIVARRQNLDAHSGDFAEESAMWNRRVAYFLLCEYEPVLTLPSANIQVFVPRRAPQCPAPLPPPNQP